MWSGWTSSGREGPDGWDGADGAFCCRVDYFSHSPFFDRQSSNQVLKMQRMHTGEEHKQGQDEEDLKSVQVELNPPVVVLRELTSAPSLSTECSQGSSSPSFTLAHRVCLSSTRETGTAQQKVNQTLSLPRTRPTPHSPALTSRVSAFRSVPCAGVLCCEQQHLPVA